MANVPALRTLDIREPQVLRHYPADANAFYWHHRVLLTKVSPGVFIALTPDGDIERLDLHHVEHLPLERRADFPGPQAPYVYAFDELSRAELERHRRRAQTMASLFNETQIDEIDAYEWMICDPSHARFGESVDEDSVAAGVTLGDSGVIELGNEEVHIKRVATSQKADLILKIDPTRGDERLLGLHKDHQGRRFLDFKSAMNLLRETENKDWPLQGPRVFMELMRAIRSGPGDIATYHLTWTRNSGVNPHSMVSHDHRIICNVIRASIETDQINAAGCLAFEILARRLVQVETAVARNPQSPDFTGLELVLEDPVGPGGEASTGVFNAWLATKLKDKANVAKQTRLFREEFRRNPDGAQSSGGGKGDGRGGGGRAKAKGRGRGAGRAGPEAGAGAAS